MKTVDELLTIYKQTPIIALEEYGLPVGTANALENKFGLYLGDILYLDRSRLFECRHLGRTRVNQLMVCLRVYWKKLEEADGNI